MRIAYPYGITAVAVGGLPDLTPKPVAMTAVKTDDRSMTDKPSISPSSGGVATAAASVSSRLRRASRAKLIARIPRFALAVAIVVSLALIVPGGQSQALAAPGDTGRRLLMSAGDPEVPQIGPPDPPSSATSVVSSPPVPPIDKSPVKFSFVAGECSRELYSVARIASPGSDWCGFIFHWPPKKGKG